MNTKLNPDMSYSEMQEVLLADQKELLEKVNKSREWYVNMCTKFKDKDKEEIYKSNGINIDEVIKKFKKTIKEKDEMRNNIKKSIKEIEDKLK